MFIIGVEACPWGLPKELPSWLFADCPKTNERAQEMGDKGKKDKEKKLKQQAKKKDQDAKAKHDKNHKARTQV
jgi:hypothetical protein